MSKNSRTFKKRNLNSPNAGWRNEPASAHQRRVLRRIERETGHEFPASISRGEATEAISARFSTDHFAAQAHRRAERARKRAARRGGRFRAPETTRRRELEVAGQTETFATAG